MKNTKPYWYEVAKGGSFEKTVFTEEMKHEVIRRINISPSRQIKKYFITASVAMLLGIILIMILQDSSLTNISVTKSTTNRAATAVIEERTLNYQYSLKSPLDLSDSGYKRTQLGQVDKSTVTIKEETEFKGIGKFLVYLKAGVGPYFGIELTDLPNALPNELFEFGPGSMTEVEFVKSNAFGESYLRLSGSCGPQVVCSFWLSYENSIPVEEFRIDSAVSETDLDGDGVIDVVAKNKNLHFNEVFIFKKIGERIEYVNVYEALREHPDDDVFYDPITRIFQIKINSNGELKNYKYAAGEDKLVLVDN
ncbi:hypothetical protein EHS13_22755 [Paenibacillus psychroresistens]|uniref:VCBS repeat-containing protein n=1 Tax=Paenibacillus psychroresistens TaxID=1778678 RepID=A0A6B8RPQ0_9BACL|nr:hypothetical protein [Paenibacillus psychroresistens]QGQ97505.1 hypothetical protein EHS13_22755 [Paenibacillus psychroresistens]